MHTSSPQKRAHSPSGLPRKLRAIGAVIQRSLLFVIFFLETKKLALLTGHASTHCFSEPDFEVRGIPRLRVSFGGHDHLRVHAIAFATRMPASTEHGSTVPCRRKSLILKRIS